MGTINTRSGKLFFDFTFREIRCREYTKLVDTRVNRKRATQILERIEAEITLGTFDYALYFPKSKMVSRLNSIQEESNNANTNTPTLRDFADTWFSENEIAWRTSHKKTIRITLDKHLTPYFGDDRVHEITKADIMAFRSSLGKIRRGNGVIGLSAVRINHIMTPLRMILNEAADRHSFLTPFRGIKPLKIRRTEVDPFTLDEVKLILDKVRDDFKNYYTVRFFTGLRTGELDGLKWEYVDFNKRQILVRESVVNGEMTYTKTDQSQRDIDMSGIVYSALKAQYAVTGHSTYVFCNREGNPLEHNNVTKRVWYPLLRHLKLKKRRPYQSRHTAATLWLASGENPEWIARQMGHSTTEMLFTVYSRYVPNLTRQDGSAMERLLAQGNLTPSLLEEIN